MSMQDYSTNEHKLQLRVDALDKELSRTRQLSRRQSERIKSLRMWLYLCAIFFIVSAIMMVSQGFIHLPVQYDNQLIVSDTVYIEKEVNMDSLKRLAYKPHSAALPKQGYNGILFAIQIGAYKGLDLSEYKDNMLGLKQDSYDSINQFTLGEFIEYEEAQRFLTVIRNMGFDQAHIMSFKNGYRLRLESALAMRQKELSNEKADKGFIEGNDERFDLLSQ